MFFLRGFKLTNSHFLIYIRIIKTKITIHMKKIILSLIAVITLLPATVKADEGMWFLMFIERLNHRDMQKWSSVNS